MKNWEIDTRRQTPDFSREVREYNHPHLNPLPSRARKGRGGDNTEKEPPLILEFVTNYTNNEK